MFISAWKVRHFTMKVSGDDSQLEPAPSGQWRTGNLYYFQGVFDWEVRMLALVIKVLQRQNWTGEWGFCDGWVMMGSQTPSRLSCVSHWRKLRSETTCFWFLDLYFIQSEGLMMRAFQIPFDKLCLLLLALVMKDVSLSSVAVVLMVVLVVGLLWAPLRTSFTAASSLLVGCLTFISEDSMTSDAEAVGSFSSDFLILPQPLIWCISQIRFSRKGKEIISFNFYALYFIDFLI